MTCYILVICSFHQRVILLLPPNAFITSYSGSLNYDDFKRVFYGVSFSLSFRIRRKVDPEPLYASWGLLHTQVVLYGWVDKLVHICILLSICISQDNNAANGFDWLIGIMLLSSFYIILFPHILFHCMIIVLFPFHTLSTPNLFGLFLYVLVFANLLVLNAKVCLFPMSVYITKKLMVIFFGRNPYLPRRVTTPIQTTFRSFWGKKYWIPDFIFGMLYIYLWKNGS